ncbi:MAG TPA: hypothetical protein VM661_09970 [Candidatus Sulfotelmatobacter sp.]|jgi:hypothetical protein|nr:hypothetical protein [Candidatus Sulfotelmatobacter sp.]
MDDRPEKNPVMGTIINGDGGFLELRYRIFDQNVIVRHGASQTLFIMASMVESLSCLDGLSQDSASSCHDLWLKAAQEKRRELGRLIGRDRESYRAFVSIGGVEIEPMPVNPEESQG